MKDVVFFKWLLKKDGKLHEQEAVPSQTLCGLSWPKRSNILKDTLIMCHLTSSNNPNHSRGLLIVGRNSWIVVN